MWKRTVDGQVLSFRLAGINNQNFLMRDQQTGSIWQQVTGKAIFGPLAGRALELLHTDELSFDLWKKEAPEGTVLAPVAAYLDDYAPKNWVERVASRPTVVSFADTPLDARALIVGISVGGADRAFPLLAVMQQWPIQDSLGKTPVLIVVGPDGKSIRAFVSRLEPDGKALEFFKKTGNKTAGDAKTGDTKTSDAKTGDAKTDDAKTADTWVLLDTSTGSEWNFQGCAVSGSAQGRCLQPVYVLKEFWFDWRLHHPATTLYKH